MEKDIYVVSKPLQYFNVRNTGYRKRNVRKVLVIYGVFIDARTFYKRVKEYDKTWDEVVFVGSRIQKYLYLLVHPCTNLFVELDASFMMGLFHKSGRFRNLYIFEEGFGSYRQNRFSYAHGIKKRLNKWTTVSERVGYSGFLCGQYLYLPDLYRKLFAGYAKEIIPFEKPFDVRIREELPLFLKLSDGYEEFLSIKDQQVSVFLTTHQVESSLLQQIINEQPSLTHFYVKPHPHIRNIQALKQYNLNIIRSNIMLEFLLQILIENGNRVTVYHENSTAVIWFQHKIVNRNMGAPFADYEIVAGYIKEHLLERETGLPD